MVKDAVSKGASVRVGGHPIGETGQFYAPTVLTNVTREMQIWKEEVFGPVRFRTTDHNDRALGDADRSVFGRSPSSSFDQRLRFRIGIERVLTQHGTRRINRIAFRNRNVVDQRLCLDLHEPISTVRRR